MWKEGYISGVVLGNIIEKHFKISCKDWYKISTPMFKKFRGLPSTKKFGEGKDIKYYYMRDDIMANIGYFVVCSNCESHGLREFSTIEQAVIYCNNNVDSF